MTDRNDSAHAARETLQGSCAAGRWLSAALEAMPEGVCLVNSAGELAYANERAQRLLDAPPDAVEQGCRLHELLDAEHAVSEWLEPAVRSEHLVRTEAGRALHAQAEPLRAGTGQVQGWLLCLREAAGGDELDELRERWSLVAEQSMLGIAILQAGRLRYCNNALAQMTGRPRAELQGMTLAQAAEMIHQADRPFVLEQVRHKSRAARRTQSQYSFRLIRPGGEQRYVQVFSRSVFYRGRPGDLACVTDTTGRELAIQQLSQCRNHLEEMVRERTESVKRAEQDRFDGERVRLIARLISAVSQKLRNPLGTIQTSLYALAERVRGTDTPVDDVLERVQRSIRRCNVLVEQMGEVCRPPELMTTTTEVDPWVERTGRALADGMDLRLELDGRGARVTMDRRRMRRALQVLCENARQAVGPGGTLTIRTRRTESGVCIAVEDEGPGMDERAARHALEPLFSTRATGLGLGLPLARTVARRHGGRLSIDTEEGEGTCVNLYLPVQNREASR
jgi:PAS domain S-box-containing protein